MWAANGVMMLGALALVLATSSLYGVVSYVVAMRSREIGVRMALGADPHAMLAMVMRQAMTIASAVPARRASRVDPIIVLRQD